ncbi:MAG: hypothetical protein ACI9ON_004104 [Limisphaerales bacterium]
MEKFNQWVTIIGNLGVIAGIFFLAYEIQANTNAVRSATYVAFNESSFSWADSQIENAAMVAKIQGYASLDEMTPEERVFWQGLMFKSFTIMESNYLHHRAGTMDDDLFEAKMVPSVSMLLDSPIWRESFNGAPLLPEFKDYMETRVRDAQ